MKFSYLSLAFSLSQFLGAIAHKNASFGQGAGPIHADDFQCVGNESRLLQCTYNSIDNCAHYEDAGVTCPGMGVLYSTALMH